MRRKRCDVTLNTTVNCKGCDKGFLEYRPRGRTTTEPGNKLLIHCIESCPDYKKLNLIRECQLCNAKFLNQNGLGTHIVRTHKELCNSVTRTWMTKRRIQSAELLSCDSSIACKGCGKSFPSLRNRGSNEYLIHCIEECQDFYNLGN